MLLESCLRKFSFRKEIRSGLEDIKTLPIVFPWFKLGDICFIRLCSDRKKYNKRYRTCTVFYVSLNDKVFLALYAAFLVKITTVSCDVFIVFFVKIS